MAPADDASNNENPIAEFLGLIPTSLFVIFITFLWTGSLYQSLEQYDLAPVLTYSIIVGSAIPVGMLFRRLHVRIKER